MNAPANPALICIGPKDEVAEYAAEYLQSIFCPHRNGELNTACRCQICAAIASHQSSTVTWIEPAGDYLLEDIEPVFSTICYQLDSNAKHAFVLANAHLLSVACANRLLKVVEEPPPGYFFMFLANDQASLLPTIQSRSTLLYQSPHHSPAMHTLLAYFTDEEKQQDPASFDTFLRNETVGVSQAKAVVHQLVLLINYAHYRQPELARHIVDKAQRNFPQAGGVNHYLRWLFMALHTAKFTD